MTKRQQHRVRDHEREFTFFGVVLGHASSKTPEKDRWTEMFIYKTEAGKYIVAGVGQSSHTGETPRAWSHICENAEGAIKRLYLYDDNNVRYMTRVSRKALEEAIHNDEALYNAYSVETVA